MHLLEIPTTLADLKHLQVRDLAENLLEGAFPANLGNQRHDDSYAESQ